MIDRLPIYWESSECMDQIDNNSIQAVITSPPYYDLKNYGHQEEIGTTDTSYREFHTRLSTVWKECYKKLKSDGTIWVVADTTMNKDGNTRLLPYHIIENMNEIGFELQHSIVWYKPTSLAGMNPKVLANKKEHILLLSKSKNIELNKRIELSNGVEDPAVFPEDEQLGDLWRFPIKRGSLGGNILHKAPFPVDLAKRMIKISTDSGDQVLDPFLGSGTTAQAALELRRQICGYEINKQFKPVVEERVNNIDIDDNNIYDWINNTKGEQTG